MPQSMSSLAWLVSSRYCEPVTVSAAPRNLMVNGIRRLSSETALACRNAAHRARTGPGIGLGFPASTAHRRPVQGRSRHCRLVEPERPGAIFVTADAEHYDRHVGRYNAELARALIELAGVRPTQTALD